MTNSKKAWILTVISLGFLVLDPDDGFRFLVCHMWATVAFVCQAIEGNPA